MHRRLFARKADYASLLAALTVIGWHAVSSAEPRAVQADVLGAAGQGPPAMLALDAYRGDQEFFVRYEAGGVVRYAGGEWRSRIQLVEIPGAAQPRVIAPSIMALEYHQAEPWPSLPADAQRLAVLDVGQWRTLRDRLLQGAVPPSGGAGLVLSFEADDYFLYYDAAGAFRAVRLSDMPSGYRIAARTDMAAYLQSGLPILEDSLREWGVTAREVVFNTGDTGAYSLPFLYANLDRDVVVFIRNVPAGRAAISPGAVAVAGTIGHTFHSHFAALALRPVSSLHRLFFLVSDVARELATPDWARLLPAGAIPAAGLEEPMDLVAWEQELDRLTGRPASLGTVRFLVDGVEFFPRLIDAISSARDSIHMRTYIFDNDDFATQIADLLKRRSTEGVDVRVLLDGFGTITAALTPPESMPDEASPVASMRAYLETGSKVEVRLLSNPWGTGDHTKTTIIDHRIAFTGGMNIGREYRYEWHDLMLEVRGPVVQIMRNDFHETWDHAGLLGDFGYLMGRLFRRGGGQAELGYPVRVLFTRPSDAEIFKTQVAAARRARQFIWVENAYLTDDAILYELVKARRRGVDVRVIIPLETDRGPITRDNALAANVMLANGIRVFIYPGMSHVKAAVFDGWVSVGSANLDKLSLRVNRELNLATSDAATAQALLNELFEPDFARSAEMTEPFPERWVDHVVEVVGDFLF